MKEYKITENVFPLADEVQLGDKVTLSNQTQEVVACQETGVKMLNIDAYELVKGDLGFIKKLGLTISNPDTDKPVALGVDYIEDSWGHKINDWFNSSEEEDNDDDSSFFGGVSSGNGRSFLGGLGSGGFGGFGGGHFSGGGASSSF